MRAYVKLLRANRAVIGRVEPRLAEVGLTLTQLGVLEAIYHKGPLTHGELGRKVLTSAGNMTGVVDKLEASGLVLRERSRADRRLIHVELTPSGHELIEFLFPIHALDIIRAMSGLDEAELDQLGRLLRKLGTGLSERPLAETTGTDQLDVDLS